MTFLPRREADLLTWSDNFSTKINLDPTAYGLTIDQASTYGGLHTAFADAYAKASDPTTNSHANIVAKDLAKEALIADARSLAGYIQRNPATTDYQRAELGLTVPDEEPTPVPPPTDPPEIDVTNVYGREISLRLYDPRNPTKRGKPAGVSGATIFRHLGDQPPADIEEWKFIGSTTRTTYTFQLPSTVAAGTKVWLTAFWTNPRSHAGPAATPVFTHVDFDGLAQAA